MPNANDPHDVLPKLLLAIAFAGEVALAVLVVFGTIISQMALGTCVDRACDYAYSTLAFYLTPITAAVIVLVSGVLALVLRNRGFRALLVPAGGALCLIGTGFAADLLLQRALAG